MEARKENCYGILGCKNKDFSSKTKTIKNQIPIHDIHVSKNSPKHRGVPAQERLLSSFISVRPRKKATRIASFIRFGKALVFFVVVFCFFDGSAP